MVGRGSPIPEVLQVAAVLGTERQDTPLVGPGREGHLGRLDRERKADPAEDRHRRGSHKKVEAGSRHPEVGTSDHGSCRTLEGSLTWT